MEIIDQVLEKCKTAGADVADAFGISRKTLSISIRNGEVEAINRATPGGLAIRYLADGKLAFAHSTDLSERSINAMIPRLSALAQKTEKDPFADMPGSQEYPQGLDIYDTAQLGESIESKLDYLRNLEQMALKCDPLITKSNGVVYEEHETTRSLGNTKGVKFEYSSTSYRVGISVVASKGDEMFPGEGSVFATHFEDLPKPEEIVKMYASRAVRLVGGTTVEAGDYEIIFTPEAAGSIYWGLNYALNGSNSFKGASFLADKMGKQVAVEGLSVIDDGLRRRGIFTRPADDEVEEGVDFRPVRAFFLPVGLPDQRLAGPLSTHEGVLAAHEIEVAGPQQAVITIDVHHGQDLNGQGAERQAVAGGNDVFPEQSGNVDQGLSLRDEAAD
jgi:PmbA protein